MGATWLQDQTTGAKGGVNADGSIPTTVTGSTIPDGQSLPVHMTTTLDKSQDSVNVGTDYAYWNNATTADDGGTVLTAADFDIRNTANHDFVVEIAAANYRKGIISIKSTLDQAVDVSMFWRSKLGVGSYASFWTMFDSASAIAVGNTTPQFVAFAPFEISTAATGETSTGSGAVNVVRGLDGPPAVLLRLACSVAPTVGTITIGISKL